MNRSGAWFLTSDGSIILWMINIFLLSTGRVDGSSKFAEGKKYGFFPSGLLHGELSNEDFMQDVNSISDLKFRVSYGVIGNQAIPPYHSLALVGPYSEGVFNSSTGSRSIYRAWSL